MKTKLLIISLFMAIFSAACIRPEISQDISIDNGWQKIADYHYAVSSLDVVPGGELFVISHGSKNRLFIGNVKNDEVVSHPEISVPGETSWVECVSKKQVVVSEIDRKVLIYDIPGKQWRVLQYPDYTNCVAVANRIILWGSNWIRALDNAVRVDLPEESITSVTAGYGDRIIVLTEEGNIYQVGDNGDMSLEGRDPLMGQDYWAEASSQSNLLVYIGRQDVYSFDLESHSLQKVYALRADNNPGDQGNTILYAFLDRLNRWWIIVDDRIVRLDQTGETQISLPEAAKWGNHIFVSQYKYDGDYLWLVVGQDILFRQRVND
jgi:hypothetical protein